MPILKTIRFTAFIICLLAATFYMYEFALQVSLGVMTHELMADLGLNAVGIGFVSACFYYAYMPMQVPAGLLHDRFGPRRVLSVAILTCAFGALLFSYSQSVNLAAIGRFLMGIGGAFSFSGALMLISRWFLPQYFAILSGFVQLMSSVGAITGEIVLAIAIRHWQWRPTMFYLFVIGIVLAFSVFVIVRDFPKIQSIQTPKKTKEIPSLREVFGRAQMWWVAIYSFLIWAPIAAFAGLWGIPFLVSAYHISTELASFACASIWVGIGFGSPFIGFISERIGRRCIVLSMCAFLGMIGSLVAIYFTSSFVVLCSALFLLGFAGSGQSLSFSVVRDASHPRVIGAAIGFNNTATVAGGAILQPFIGYLLHHHWNGLLVNGAPYYSVFDYRIALIMLPICYFLAWLVSVFLIKETRCKQVYELQV